MKLTVTSIALLGIGVLNLSIGAGVYRRAPTAHLNRAFGCMALLVASWTMALLFAHYGSSGHTIALRLAFAVSSFLPFVLIVFVTLLPPDGVRVLGTRIGILLLGISICSAVASLTPLIVVSASPATFSNLRIAYGPLHAAFGAFFIASFLYAAHTLFRKLKGSTGATNSQNRFILLALVVPIGLATVTNLAVPLFFRTSNLSRYGPFFSLLFLALIGHAIIRHRLMDIRVVIRKSAVYLAAFFAAGAVLLILLVGSNFAFQQQQQTPVREIILALAVAVFFSPLKAHIQRAFDRYLYREPYDYQRTIREASRSLGGTIELPELVVYVQSLIGRTLKPSHVAIYLRDEEEGWFDLVTTPLADHSPRTLFSDSPLVIKAVHQRDAVFLDEIPDGIHRSEAGVLRGEFERLDAEVVVPLFEEKQLIGLMGIGAKRSRDPYFSDDADLLTTLANQAAVAFRNAQAHLRVVHLNEGMQKILSTIESGVIAIGPRGKVTLCNRAAEQLTGVLEETVRGRPVDHLPAPLARLLAATAADGQTRLQVEIALPNSAGQLVSLVCSTSPLHASHGATGGVVAVLADLTRLRELEQHKRSAERLASYEAIASGLVHEVRNPLVAIKTFAQLLPIRFHDEEFRNTLSRVTVREIERIDDLLTRFRTLSSPASEPMQALDVSLPIRDALEALHPRLEAQQISLRRVGAGAPRPILGNALQLEQLFLNLCTNAIEAMRAGGELTVRIADLSSAGGTSLLVEISDTGTGIPEDLLATIFDPFVTTKPQGTGLGLAICRSITDAHHARLSVRNNVERLGCTFTIEFPVLVGGPARVTP